MGAQRKNQVIFFFIMFFFVSFSQDFYSQDKFTVVIDAGHGGKDPGALGKKTTEKKITLAVALKLGTLIEKNNKDVKVIYTRKGDTYPTLQERVNTANKNKANLFISIHTNSTKSQSATGTETYTFGLSKSKANLEVAMRENSVILLEDDYKTKYQGFDPSSVESYIMFELMQDEYYDKSLIFASNIQKSICNHCKTKNRGVRQAPFWVLHRSACPSVLIELGFISNPEEEKYLSSPKGQQEMARAIYKSFDLYKQDYDKKTGNNLKKNTSEKKVSEKEEKTSPKKEDNFNAIFRVQLLVSGKKLDVDDRAFKGIKDVEYYVENGMYKYTVGNYEDYNKAVKRRDELKSSFDQAFIIKFRNGKRIN